MARVKHKPARVEEKVEGVANRPHRWRPGTRALREIRKVQKGVELLIPKGPFKRVVNEIARSCAMNGNIRVRRDAALILQTFTEAQLVGLLRQANRIALDNKRVTIMPKDLRFVAAAASSDLEQQGTL
jgi:histone H3/H4